MIFFFTYQYACHPSEWFLYSCKRSTPYPFSGHSTDFSFLISSFLPTITSYFPSCLALVIHWNNLLIPQTLTWPFWFLTTWISTQPLALAVKPTTFFSQFTLPFFRMIVALLPSPCNFSKPSLFILLPFTWWLCLLFTAEVESLWIDAVIFPPPRTFFFHFLIVKNRLCIWSTLV